VVRRTSEGSPSEALGLDDAHDVFFTHDQQFLAIDLDGLTSVLAKQDTVTHLHCQGTHAAILKHFAIANGANLRPGQAFPRLYPE
jgi:hypothetical protein